RQAPGHLADAVELVPGQRRQVKAPGLVTYGGWDGVAQHCPLATAVDRHVRRDTQAHVARRLHARDDAPYPVVVALDVELERLRELARRRDTLQVGVRPGGDDVHGAE